VGAGCSARILNGRHEENAPATPATVAHTAAVSTGALTLVQLLDQEGQYQDGQGPLAGGGLIDSAATGVQVDPESVDGAMSWAHDRVERAVLAVGPTHPVAEAPDGAGLVSVLTARTLTSSRVMFMTLPGSRGTEDGSFLGRRSPGRPGEHPARGESN
jgi:hypothetical protein